MQPDLGPLNSIAEEPVDAKHSHYDKWDGSELDATYSEAKPNLQESASNKRE